MVRIRRIVEVEARVEAPALLPTVEHISTRFRTVAEPKQGLTSKGGSPVVVGSLAAAGNVSHTRRVDVSWSGGVVAFPIHARTRAQTYEGPPC